MADVGDYFLILLRNKAAMYDIATILLVAFAICLAYRGCRDDVQNARERVIQTQANAQLVDEGIPSRSSAAEPDQSANPPAYREVVT